MINRKWPFSTPGLPDDYFLRDPEVPMTKEEVRVVTLGKARIHENSVIYDIGAGTGSISVECALLATGGVVYAIEKHPGAVQILRENITAFGLNNVVVVPEEAPAALKELPAPDRVIIGGSSGRLLEILAAVASKMSPGARVVINSITIETTTAGIQGLDQLGFLELDVVCVRIDRAIPRGKVRMWQGGNPVYVISAVKGGNEVG
ncbi:MAG: precorrin-6Y C5,15-methyltransferase (decarboxylating) subunit CbiT [Bacillota bacterium]